MESKLAIAASDRLLRGELPLFRQAMDGAGPVNSNRWVHMLGGIHSFGACSEAHAALGRNMCRSDSSIFSGSCNRCFSSVAIVTGQACPQPEADLTGVEDGTNIENWKNIACECDSGSVMHQCLRICICVIHDELHALTSSS